MTSKPDKRPALGRGLSALIPDTPTGPPEVRSSQDLPHEVDLDLLDPNPHQPRLHFNDAGLDELAASIRSNGLVQPIVVRRHGQRFDIIAGERRWRAAQRAGLLKVPVVVRDIPDERLLEMALIENIQREDLNPIDEALAYRRLMTELTLTQEQVAALVGKDRASVANHLRLLKLPDELRTDVAHGTLSTGHAKALLSLEEPGPMRSAATQVRTRALSVRDTEALVKRMLAPPAETPAAPAKDVHTRDAEERLRMVLGTRVTIRRRGKGGRLEIEFVNEEELIRLFELLSGK